jgi:hypothetical protein
MMETERQNRMEAKEEHKRYCDGLRGVINALREQELAIEELSEGKDDNDLDMAGLKVTEAVVWVRKVLETEELFVD